MGNLLRDCKYSLRVLRKSPGFTILAILALALGIGANSAIFGIVNAVLLRPLPFEDSEKLVQVWHVPPQKIFPGVPIFVVSAANYLDWRKQNDVFENMAVFGYKNVNLTGNGEPAALVASAVSADFFPVLHKRALLGRVFTPEEDEPGHSDVVVLGNNLWRTTFGASRDIIGQKITLDDHAFTVIGVMEPDFEFPQLAKLWTPLGWTDKDRAVRDSHDFQVIARLKPGVSIKQAQAEMATISQRLEQQYPAVNTGWGATVVSLRDQTIGNARGALLVLLGAVGFVLLIACANVANLMLARILGRQKEIALRTALGAKAIRVLQQILSESIILGLAGGALGLFIAWSGIHLMADFLVQNVPRSTEITLDASVIIFTFCISILAGSLAGIIPGWLLTRTNLNEALKQGLSRTDSSSGGGQIRNGLVVTEVALTIVLLIAAGLMVRTLSMLRRVDPGIDPHNILTVSAALPANKYSQPFRQSAFFDQVLQRVRSLPGVQSAGATSLIPLVGNGPTQPISIEGRPAGNAAEQPAVGIRRITPGYLHTMYIPLKRGRDFNDSDAANQPAVVLISESMAKSLWRDQDPIGKHVTLTFFPQTTREIVGVVGDVKQNGLDATAPSPILYVPLAQLPQPFMSFVVRTTSVPSSLISAVSHAVHEVDSEQPVVNITSIDEVLDASLSQQHFNMLLLGIFASLALVLAALGIYSVLSYVVRRRVQEIGIRMALGAQISDVLKMIVLQGMLPAAIGMLLGLVGAFAFSRLLSSFVYGISPSDPLTFGAVAIVLTTVAFLACLIPGYRATKIEPIKALRQN